MEYRRLGRTGLRVSLASLGTGGPSKMGQNRGTTPDDARRLTRRALDHGINFFDTAASYGDSEILLGHGLAGLSRDDFIVATKYSPLADKELKSPEGVQASIDSSLERLGLDYIDVIQVHGLMPDRYDAIIEQHLPVLLEAQRAGKVGFLGVTEQAHDDVHHETFKRMAADGHFDTFMVGYNLLHQTAEQDVLKAAEAADIGLIVMIAVRRALGNPARLREVIAELKAAGHLAPDALPDDDPLGWLVHGDVESVPEAAYRFVLEPSAISTVLTGTANPDHLDANVASMARGPLPPEDRTRLQSIFGGLALGLGN
jgi:aryl-alcohol dehydrogenase-like predicted oxidoreductase